MTKKMLVLWILVLFAVALSWGQQGVSDEALRHMTRGQAAVETAKSPADYKSAIAEFEQACSLAPSWPDARYNLAKVQEAAGDFDGAIRSYQKYLELAPGSDDAADVKTHIFKLEYQRERSNIEGMWKVDPARLDLKCSPTDCLSADDLIIGTNMLIEAMRLDIRKTVSGLQVCLLSTPGHFPCQLPDGPPASVEHNGDEVRITGAVLYACPTEVVPNSCPWNVKLVLHHTSADVLEGTIEASGGVKRISDLRTQATQYVPFNGVGRITVKRTADRN